MKRIGILYHPKRKETIQFSRKLEVFLKGKGFRTWMCSAWEPEQARCYVEGTDLLLSVGGDGTILRSARTAIPESIPILGINMGKLGFMAELKADEAIEKLPAILDGKAWIEEHTMLKAELASQGKTLYALNDVFVGRRSSARLVNIVCRLNNTPLTTYRADGVVVATASGSTGYSLAAGGPILHPQAKEMLLTPICSHFSFSNTMVLPSNTRVELTVNTTHEALLSIDGQTEVQLKNGDSTKIMLSPYSAKFLRIRPKTYFYKFLDSKLKRKVQ